ncbi:hypothetical protein [Streptomyces syringium]|uniref:hypothetical protein n=1 Tax=Streptomyces syringium TaxID=76729 RepID=UPI003441619F
MVDALVDQEVRGGFVSQPAFHRPVKSAVPGERGEFVGASGELLLFLEALQLGFRGSPVGGEFVLDDGVGPRAVCRAGGGEQQRNVFPLRDFGGAAVVVGRVLGVAVEVLRP